MNVFVWYWGRETSKYTLELLRAFREIPNLNLVLSCSQGSDLHHAASQLEGLPIIPVTTYTGVKQSWRGRLSALRGVLALPRRILRIRRLLRQYQIDVAVCAQGAVWDVAIVPLLTRGRVRYVQVAHEVISHPGETYPLRDQMTLRHIAVADGIVVLSEQIRRQVIDRWHCPPERCWKMPHGAYIFGDTTGHSSCASTRPASSASAVLRAYLTIQGAGSALWGHATVAATRSALQAGHCWLWQSGQLSRSASGT